MSIVYGKFTKKKKKRKESKNYPFTCSGVHFTGSFLLKYKYERKRIYNKVYVAVAIFICFVTYPIHLEIITELSSQTSQKF